MNSETIFPRGLFQPKGSFKFSIDALLLAAFSDVNLTKESVLDLGSGCGVVGFALLLRQPQLEVVGVDIQEALVTASQENARTLFLENRYSAVCCDVSLLIEPQPKSLDDKAILSSLSPASFDLVVANPPYHILGNGRQPKELLRLHALFGNKQTLSNFCNAAAKMLKPKGRYCFVLPPSRLSEAFSCCKAHKLGVSRVLCVHTRDKKKAELIFIEAKKEIKDNITIEPPLFLYDKGELSDMAQKFCPELV